MANRDLYRYGYKDKVKRTGALPRLDEDAKKYDKQPIFEPDAAFAPKRALYGQNDYIDILGMIVKWLSMLVTDSDIRNSNYTYLV